MSKQDIGDEGEGVAGRAPTLSLGALLTQSKNMSKLEILLSPSFVNCNLNSGPIFHSRAVFASVPLRILGTGTGKYQQLQRRVSFTDSP